VGGAGHTIGAGNETGVPGGSSAPAGAIATVGALATGALPFTGFPIYGAVLIGLTLLVLGLVLLRRARATPERPHTVPAAATVPTRQGDSRGP
jgi:hypothetical protein